METPFRISAQVDLITYTSSEMLIKFNRLKSQYNNTLENKTIIDQNDEECMKEQDLKNTLENLNFTVTEKLGELRGIKDRLIKLSNYKKNLSEILTSMRNIEKDYIKLFQTNVLCTGDLLLEPPRIYVPELLSGDLRKPPDDKEIVLDPIRLRGQLYSIKSEYVNSLCDIYEKIDDKILDETFKMKKITDFLDIYKNAIDSCDTHKKTLSKYNCTVCYEKEVNMCIQPCGHTFCASCTEKITNRCFACNGTVTAKMKMYLLGKDDGDDDEAVPDTAGGEVQPANDRNYPTRNAGIGLVGQLMGLGQRI